MPVLIENQGFEGGILKKIFTGKEIKPKRMIPSFTGR